MTLTSLFYRKLGDLGEVVSGVRGGVRAGCKERNLYKFRIRSQQNGYVIDKADPFGVRQEEPPRTASVVWDLDYGWSDSDWVMDAGAGEEESIALLNLEWHILQYPLHRFTRTHRVWFLKAD
jgi:1,4-alpha-glucan branching enzyme